MSASRGLLVVIEGVNGAGKTTIINELIDYYKSVNKSVSVYKFPDRKGKHGVRIDSYLKGELEIKSKYDILSMFAANRHSVKEDIVRDLSSGKIVLCDRYVFSAIAYHIPPSITDLFKIHNYCNIIGYFDREMPLPSVVYLIEGDHLAKRGIVHRERFHLHGDRSQKLKNMIYRVIRNYNIRFGVLRNLTNESQTVVNYIINDLDMYM